MSPLVVVPSNVVVVVLVDIIVEPLSKSGRVVIRGFRVACGTFPLIVVPIFDVVLNIVLVDIVVEPRSKSSNIVVAK